MHDADVGGLAPNGPWVAPDVAAVKQKQTCSQASCSELVTEGALADSVALSSMI